MICKPIELILFTDISASNAGCNILKNCHSDASCMYSEANDEFFCRLVPIQTFYWFLINFYFRCKAGFMGDGYEECEEEPKIGCNVINNCHRFASCDYDPKAGGYDCHCDTVRGFIGDGYNCTPEMTCFENPAICDPNADCIPTRDHQSKCR